MTTETTKKAYQEKIEAQLHEVDARIELLKAKEEQLEADAKQEYSRFMDDLRDKRASVKSELQALTETSAETWQDVHEEVDAGMKSLSALVSKAAQRFNVISPQHDVEQQDR